MIDFLDHVLIKMESYFSCLQASFVFVIVRDTSLKLFVYFFKQTENQEQDSGHTYILLQLLSF